MISGTSCYRTAHGDPRLRRRKRLASHYESLLLIPDGRGLCVNLHHTTRVSFLFCSPFGWLTYAHISLILNICLLKNALKIRCKSVKVRQPRDVHMWARLLVLLKM